jgi:hypothetical protein
MHSTRRLLVASLALVVPAALPQTAQISGSVTDPSGAVIASALKLIF